MGGGKRHFPPQDHHYPKQQKRGGGDGCRFYRCGEDRGRTGGGGRVFTEERGSGPSGLGQQKFRSWEVEETKKLLPFYRKIVEWDDLAAKKAFYNAKARFQAQIKGLCDSDTHSFPDPDEFIDEINWDEEIDPELLIGLEEPSYPLPEDKEKTPKPTSHGRNVWDSSAGSSCLEKKNNSGIGGNNGWDCCDGWDNNNNSSWKMGNNSWGQWENNENGSLEQWQKWKRDADMHYNYFSETRRRHGKKSEVVDCEWKPFGSKNRNPAPMNNTSKHYTGRKRSNQDCEQAIYNKRRVDHHRLQMNRFQSCRPID